VKTPLSHWSDPKIVRQKKIDNDRVRNAQKL